MSRNREYAKQRRKVVADRGASAVAGSLLRGPVGAESTVGKRIGSSS